MKPLPWILALGAVAGVAVFGDFNTDRPEAERTITPPEAREPEEGDPDPVELVGVDDAPAREAVSPSPSLEPDPLPLDELETLRANLAAAGEELAALHAENRALAKRVEWLETELALCGSEVTQGPTGRWLASLTPEERPPEKAIRFVAAILREYPVELTPAEGAWIVERFTRDDWKEWGRTVDDAVILFLGPRRIAGEVPDERLKALRRDWLDEGYFGG